MDGALPTWGAIKQRAFEKRYVRYIGKIHDKTCFAMDIEQGEHSLSYGNGVGIRQLYALLPAEQMQAALLGYQVVLWNRKNKFCGQCGSRTEERSAHVLVKTCPDCQAEFYPRISPSVIVAVKRDHELLLAQHKRITNGMYTVLAGFVNPGETLEECVCREIKEEAGIEVRNLKYFGSQPWPFPDSLMIGFTADYAGGRVEPDHDEITDLKWFKADEIPEWPDKVSIARALIDDFIENNRE